MKGTKEASRLARETREYLRENIKRPEQEFVSSEDDELPPTVEKFKDLS